MTKQNEAMGHPSMMGLLDLPGTPCKDTRCRETSHLNASLGSHNPQNSPTTSSDKETPLLIHLDRGFTTHRPQRQVRMEGLETGKHRQNCYPERGTRDVTGVSSKARSLLS